MVVWVLCGDVVWVGIYCVVNWLVSGGGFDITGCYESYLGVWSEYCVMLSGGVG